MAESVNVESTLALSQAGWVEYGPHNYNWVHIVMKFFIMLGLGTLWTVR